VNLARALGRLSAGLRVLILLALVVPPARADLPLPPLEARVTDTAGVLDAPRRAALEAKLAAFEAARGAQIAVLVVPTTGDEPIESYALRVAETWRLGRGKVDDGALLVVAIEDRALRIEVGYGLEGALTDATSKRIIEETLVPAFRAGDYAGGIERGVERMLAVVAGEPLPAPAPRRGGESPFALALFLAVFFASMFRGLRAAPARGGLAALGAGGGTLLLTQVAGAAGLSALAALVLALLFEGGGPRSWSSHRRYGNRWPGGWTSGGFGGGGFSGGGGGFGGGGASGRW
jgi:uncharacterized protein